MMTGGTGTAGTNAPGPVGPVALLLDGLASRVRSGPLLPG